MKIFGRELFGPKKEKKIAADDFIRRNEDADASIVIASGDAILHTANFLTTFETDKQRIESYRRCAMTTYVDSAVDDIVDEAVDFDKFTGTTVKINLDNTRFSDDIKKTITEEFDEVLRLMSFGKDASEHFREWYVDGKLFFYVVPKSDASGIKEIRKLDTRFIKRVKKIYYDEGRTFEDNLRIPRTEIAYMFIKPDQEDHELSWVGAYAGVGKNEVVQIAEEAVAYCDSGLFDATGKSVSYIERALKPFNQLSMLEDAIVIYRISRAPERRVFYIDVGQMPPKKAEEYLKQMINKFRGKMQYDPTTGTTSEQYEIRNMMEDIWLPRQEGKNTEVTTLPAGQNLGEIEDILYFRKKLYKAMKIPVSRLEAENTFNLGRTAEISRDEVRFSKFIRRLTRQFSNIFSEVLKRQLVLKKVVTLEEWNDNKNDIEYVFATNSYFQELKQLEILDERLNRLDRIDPLVGKYYSKDFVQRNVLGMNDEDIEEQQALMDEELEAGKIVDGVGGAKPVGEDPAAAMAGADPAMGGEMPVDEEVPVDPLEGEDLSPMSDDLSGDESFAPSNPELDFAPSSEFSDEGVNFAPIEDTELDAMALEDEDEDEDASVKQTEEEL